KKSINEVIKLTGTAITFKRCEDNR
ncbi:MAG: hypothetical protein RLZZ316_3074, partial [Bacteroidota bacterium]